MGSSVIQASTFDTAAVLNTPLHRLLDHYTPSESEKKSAPSSPPRSPGKQSRANPDHGYVADGMGSMLEMHMIRKMEIITFRSISVANHSSLPPSHLAQVASIRTERAATLHPGTPPPLEVTDLDLTFIVHPASTNPSSPLFKCSQVTLHGSLSATRGLNTSTPPDRFGALSSSITSNLSAAVSSITRRTITLASTNPGSNVVLPPPSSASLSNPTYRDDLLLVLCRNPLGHLHSHFKDVASLDLAAAHLRSSLLPTSLSPPPLPSAPALSSADRTSWNYAPGLPPFACRTPSPPPPLPPPYKTPLQYSVTITSTTSTVFSYVYPPLPPSVRLNQISFHPKLPSLGVQLPSGHVLTVQSLSPNAVSQIRGGQMPAKRLIEKMLDPEYLKLHDISVVEETGTLSLTAVAENITEATLTLSRSSPPPWTGGVLARLRAAKRELARPAAAVEAELRAIFPSPPTYQSLPPDLQAICDSCLSLESASGLSLQWRKHPTKSPILFFQSCSPPPPLPPALSAVTVTLDCPAKEALAWFFACLPGESALSKSVETMTVATIDRFSTCDETRAALFVQPWPLQRRSVFVRRFCVSDSASNSFLLCTASVSTGSRTARSPISPTTPSTPHLSVLRCTPLSATSCRVRLLWYQPADLPSYAPLLGALSGQLEPRDQMEDARAIFERDDELDGQLTSAVSADVQAQRDGPVEVPYSSEEIESLDRVTSNLEALQQDAFADLESPDHFVKMGIRYNKGNSAGILRASTIIDAEVAPAVAVDLAMTSRNSMKHHHNRGGLERNVHKNSPHERIYQVVVDLGIPGLQPREWLMRIALRWESVGDEGRKACVVVYESLKPGDREENRFGPPNKNYADVFRSGRSRVLDSESKYFESGLNHVKKSEDIGSRKQIKNSAVGTNNFIAFVAGDKVGWGRSEVDVRANKADVLAYMWHNTAKARWSKRDAERTVLEKINDHHWIVYQRKKAAKVFGRFTVGSRDGVSRTLWESTDDGKLVLVGLPAEHDARPITTTRDRVVASVRKSRTNGRQAETNNAPDSADVVRAKMSVVMTIEQKSSDVCRITLVNQLNMGGDLPTFMVNYMIRQSMAITTNILYKFQEERTLQQYDSTDGRAIGNRLIAPYLGGKKVKKPSKLVHETADKHRGLKEVSDKYPWFKAWLTELVKGQLRFVGGVDSKLDCLTLGEARQIGMSLPKALRQRKTPEAGVYQWEKQNPAMIELFKEFPWTEDMVISIAKHILKTAPWGMLWRLCTGSGLSMLDMASDLNVVVLYWNIPEQRHFGVSILMMIVACLLLQMLIVIMQADLKNKKKQAAFDIATTLTGLKPGVDAMNVALGKEKEGTMLFDPKVELVYTKCIEMFCESIPGTIVQTYAYLKYLETGQTSTRAIASIFISAATTGFTSACVSYDLDTDPGKRRMNPLFYGYIPDSARARTVLFLTMMVNSGMLLVMRCVSATLLLSISTSYFVYYWLADNVLFLLFKLMRRDFVYFIPMYGAGAWIVACLQRFIVKNICDYTAILHFRGPFELGGFYWSLNLVLTIGSAFGSTAVYLEMKNEWVPDASPEQREDQAIVYKSTAWLVMSGLAAVWFLSFVAMIKTMKPEYRWTFFSLRSGPQHCRFMHQGEGHTDEMKKEIVGENKYFWTSIRSEVKQWHHDNWWRWQEEKPDWFNDSYVNGLKADGFEDFVPEEPELDGEVDAKALAEGAGRERKGGGGGKTGRRKSLAEALGISQM
ncbi:hypothetical protein TeGR_g8001 [Tetraparma gracilis]|uniref:START domain-containing protein n=1 Tax=Tetraparma gracilis TaxID=2962635 RepID=A0ABQ6MJM8_9STRA|nr:hypothetical protein TeGR_g8001 [Tetraparma gracilis]